MLHLGIGIKTNFQVGKAGTGNTFNVKQNSCSFRDEAVQLLKSNSSRQSQITNDAVTPRSLITLLSATINPNAKN